MTIAKMEAPTPKLPPEIRSGPLGCESSNPPASFPDTSTPKMPSSVKVHAKWMPIAIHSRRVRM